MNAPVELGPDDGHVSEVAVGDPPLGAVEAEATPGQTLRAGDHPGGVRAEVGFGQAEAADDLPLGHAGQILLLLRLRPEGVDRVHAERALHRAEGAHPGVATLELLHGEPVGHVAHPRAAVALEVGPEEAELGHLRDQVHREGAGLVVVGDGGHHLRLDEAADAVANQPLVLLKLVIDSVVIHQRHVAPPCSGQVAIGGTEKVLTPALAPRGGVCNVRASLGM